MSKYDPAFETEVVPVPKTAAPIILQVTHAANHIKIWVNGRLLVEEDTEGDPELNIEHDLSGIVSPGPNNSIVTICLNRGGPYHIVYKVTQSGGFSLGVDLIGEGGGLVYAEGWNFTYRE